MVSWAEYVARRTAHKRALDAERVSSAQSTPPSDKPTFPKPAQSAGQDAATRRKTGKHQLSGRKCRVPGCFVRQCSLKTHRDYKPGSVQYESLPRDAVNDTISLVANDSAWDQFHSYEDLESSYFSGYSVIKGIDARPTLPLDGLEAPHAQELFHIFFSTRLDHILRLGDPPPISNVQRRIVADVRSGYFTGALTNPFICTMIIAAAYFPLALKEGSGQLNRTALILHSKLLSLLRNQLSSNIGELHAPDVAMAIFTITIFEIVIAGTTKLAVHKDAMKRVVASGGGLQNMRQATKHILAFDRIVSNFTAIPRAFPPVPHRRLRRPTQYPQIYGSCLESFAVEQTEEEAVIDHCADTCRLIELVEGMHFSFDPAIPLEPRSPDVYYMYYLREGNMDDFTQLHIQMVDKEDIFRCILLTAGIVSYAVVQTNYIPMIPHRYADIVRSIMTREAFKESCPNQDILRWILFVLVTMEFSWPGRKWAVAELRTMLTNKHGEAPWSANWKKMELDNIRNFVWSDFWLGLSLSSAFEELDFAGVVLLQAEEFDT